MAEWNESFEKSLKTFLEELEKQRLKLGGFKMSPGAQQTMVGNDGSLTEDIPPAGQVRKGKQ